MFTIEIASVEDREKLVAELWWEKAQVAELSDDHGHLLLQLFPPPTGRYWEFDYGQFAEMIVNMPKRLAGK